MKNVTTAHIAIKQSILSDLVNSGDSQYYNNVKISLLNNALVFPVSLRFDAQQFADAVAQYLNTDLKVSSSVEKIGDDIYSLPFSPIGLGLMKKTIVFSLIDQHLYINIVPVKEIENANYSEGRISELLSSGKSDKIYDFAEQYIISQYPEGTAESVKPSGRYFYTTSLGVAAILASHLEEGEHILAKLDIYKIEKSKSNAMTGDADISFYVMTTNGAYLMVLDNNLQEKYIETLSDSEMTVQQKIGRDPVYCGQTQWLSNRDNDFLFDEVSPFNHLGRNEKLKGFARLHFNFGEDVEDRRYSAKLLNILAEDLNTPFAKFEASLIEFSTTIVDDNDDKVSMDKAMAIKMMECANSLFSEDDFEVKIQQFLNDFKFSPLELVTIVFVVSRAKNRINDSAVFVSVLKMLKERFFKVDSNIFNRGFICLSIARKLNMIGEKEPAAEFAQEAYDVVGFNPASMLAPGMGTSPDNPYTGDPITYCALEELYKSAPTAKDKMRFAQEMAELKPLIKSNIEKLQKLSPKDLLNSKVQTLMSVFDAELFSSFSCTNNLELGGKFSKISSSLYMPEYTEWRKTYSGFKSWVSKAQVDKSISSIKEHGELVTTNNFHQLFELSEQLSKYFELDGVEIYVFNNRGQGIMSNDDGTSKYIFIDGEQLEINDANYLNGNELTFALAREYASLKLGFSRLTCHPQWRNYAQSGVASLDVISTFAAEPDFIKSEASNYNKLLGFTRLLDGQKDYFEFDVVDTDLAAELLSETLTALHANSGTKVDALKEREFSALSLLTAHILDRIGLIVAGNIVYAVKSMIHNDKQINVNPEFFAENPVSILACSKDSDGKSVNYDFAMRLNSLLGFYLSDDYKKY